MSREKVYRNVLEMQEIRIKKIIQLNGSFFQSTEIGDERLNNMDNYSLTVKFYFLLITHALINTWYPYKSNFYGLKENNLSKLPYILVLH